MRFKISVARGQVRGMGTTMVAGDQSMGTGSIRRRRTMRSFCRWGAPGGDMLIGRMSGGGVRGSGAGDVSIVSFGIVGANSN